MAALDSGDLVLILIAIFLPPVTAVITDGCGGQFCLNILLTLLGGIPGIVHAIWLVYRKAEREQRSGLRGGQAGGQPIYVQQPAHNQRYHPEAHHQQQGYGAIPPNVEPQYAQAPAPAAAPYKA